MTSEIVGRRCVSVRLFRHRFAGEITGDRGPIEFGWADGGFTTVDTRLDFSLRICDGPWEDPFAGTPPDRLREIAVELGLWESFPVPDDLQRVVGRVASSAELKFTRDGELDALVVFFGDLRVEARSSNEDGEVAVETTRADSAGSETPIDIGLTNDERFVLDRGMAEWSGPAHCTEALAIAMGFESIQDFLEKMHHWRAELKARHPLARRDWTRMLLAAEISFVSDVVGSGVEWETTTGLGDAHTIEILRSVQRRIRGKPDTAVLPV